MPRPWALVAAVLACLVAGALLLREPIGRRLFPDAAVAGLVAQAEQALARGDTTAAATHFQAAQARSPDHPRVADGLAETRDLALRQAERALSSGDRATAGRELALAAALGAPGDPLDRLRKALLMQAEPSTEVLLQRAAGLEARDAAAALALYRQVLEQAPMDVVARAGRGRLLAAMLADAGRALEQDDEARAAALVAEVRRLDPAHLQLPDMEMRLGARGIVLPSADASTLASTSATAAAAARWRGLAEEAIGRGAVGEARRALEKARALEPAAAELEALELRLRRTEAASSAGRR